ncbi:MAG TPA: energy transducer TonB [Opitutaceae bacterium]
MLLSGCATSSALRPVVQAIPPTPVGVYDISQVTSQPRPVSQSAPRYPRELRAERISGEATIHFIVNRNGEVVAPIVVKADDARLGEAAREAVATWRFEPARVDGRPVDCAMMVPITFSLGQ